MLNLKAIASAAARRVSIGGLWDDSSSAVSESVVEDETPRRPDDEIMAEMSGRYYAMAPDAVTGDVLAHLPDVIDFAWIENAIWEHEHALEIVNGDISARVLSSYNEFVEGMRRIHDVGIDLQQSGVVCKNARLGLHAAKEQAASPSLRIVSKYRRQQLCSALISILTDIQRVSNSTKELDQLLSQQDYAKAIVARREIEKVEGKLVKLGRLRCVDALHKSTASAWSMLASRLDESLREACLSFNRDNYSEIIKAYQRINRAYEILGKLQENFAEDLERRSRQSVLACVDHAFLERVESSKMRYQQLCEGVDQRQQQQLVPCLLGLLGVCTDLMWNYHYVRKWHEDESTGESADKELRDVRQGLESWRGRFWELMQRNVVALLSRIRLSQLQAEDAIRAVEAGEAFARIGVEFGGARSTVLQQELKKMSVTFLSDVRRSTAEDLQTMFENEQWTKLPVAVRVLDIKEVKAAMYNSNSASLQYQRSFFATFTAGANPFFEAANQYTTLGADSMTPFSELMERKTAKPASRDEAEEDADEEESPDQFEQSAGSRAEEDEDEIDEDEQLIVTSSAMNIAKKIGKYVSMLRVMDTVSTDVLNVIIDLHNCYLWTVWALFVTPPLETRSTKGVFDGIREQMSRPQLPPGSLLSSQFQTVAMSSQGQQLAAENGLVIEKPESFAVVSVSARLDMTNAINLYALAHRIAATESLLFLRDVFDAVRAVLLDTLSQPIQRERLSKFLAQSVDTVETVRAAMYRSVIGCAITVDQVPAAIEKVKWDGAVGNDRPYVTSLTKEIALLSSRLKEVQKQGYLPTRLWTLAWENAALLVMDALLEGFSRIKRCSNEGRAMMTMDLQVVSSALEKASGLKPLPGASVVDIYIKAFYFTDAEFMDFAKAHTEFTSRMLVNMICCNTSSVMKRKQRDDLQKAVEDATRSRVRQPLWRSWYTIQRSRTPQRADAFFAPASSHTPQLYPKAT
eukprot:m51a1_g6652 hypothetical protein (973) ;mRNA; r:138499-141826